MYFHKSIDDHREKAESSALLWSSLLFYGSYRFLENIQDPLTAKHHEMVQ